MLEICMSVCSHGLETGNSLVQKLLNKCTEWLYEYAYKNY